MKSNILKFTKPKPPKVQITIEIELDTYRGLYFKGKSMELFKQADHAISIEEVAGQLLDEQYQLIED